MIMLCLREKFLMPLPRNLGVYSILDFNHIIVIKYYFVDFLVDHLTFYVGCPVCSLTAERSGKFVVQMKQVKTLYMYIYIGFLSCNEESVTKMLSICLHRCGIGSKIGGMQLEQKLRGR